MAKGQAVIEYIFIFAFMALLGVAVLSRFGPFLGDHFGKLSFTISNTLSTGVCKDYCFLSNYEN